MISDLSESMAWRTIWHSHKEKKELPPKLPLVQCQGYPHPYALLFGSLEEGEESMGSEMEDAEGAM